MNYNIKNTIVRLAEIASSMVDANEAQKASPEEVLAGLQNVASELENIMDSIPAQQTSEPAAPAPAKAPAPKKENPSQVAKLEHQLKILQAKIDEADRKEIATKYAELYDESQFTAKYDEVMNSTEPNSVWTAKTEAIAQFAKDSNLETYRPQKSASFSYQRTARLVSPKEMRSL